MPRSAARSLYLAVPALRARVPFARHRDFPPARAPEPSSCPIAAVSSPRGTPSRPYTDAMETDAARPAPPPERDLSRSAQDYLKAIYKLQDDGPVLTSALAERMGVAAPSATNAIGRLADAGLLSHVPYRGVRLTERGAAVALEVIRHHRLWEAFLHRALGVPLDQLHDEAERLEHELSDVLEDHILRVLGNPAFDPHGDPIPGRDGSFEEDWLPTLADLVTGTGAIVRRVPDSDPEFLRYLGALGILPSARIEILAREPYLGPLRLTVDGAERVIGYELASRVQAEPTTGDEITPG